MSDLMSEIRDDIREYVDRCSRMGETVKYKNDSPDCYGFHAKHIERIEKLNLKN